MAETGIIDIQCGEIKGKMHLEKFICPGIHEPCIEVNGEMITPKLMVVIADKAKLKDWKNAIRYKGVSFRKLLENGGISFYDHKNKCTGKCISRMVPKNMWSSYMESKDLPTMVSLPSQINKSLYNSYKSQQSSSQEQPLFPTPIAVPAGGSIKQETVTDPDTSDQSSDDVKQEIKTEEETPLDLIQKDDASEKLDIKPDDTVTCNMVDMFPDGETLVEDSQAFWTGIVGVGLTEEFFREIKASLDVLKRDIISHCKEEDTMKASQVVQLLGMSTKLQHKLAAHRMATEQRQRKITTEIQALRMKMQEQEQREQALKRKSMCFNHLIEMAAPKKTRTSPSTTNNGPIDYSMTAKDESSSDSQTSATDHSEGQQNSTIPR